MTVIADIEARRRAQVEFERPLVLEAGAGTGKTAVLVARAVAWLLGPGWERAERAGARDPAARASEGIVAITFTEAAAAEMADRIGEALGRLARGEAVVGLLDEALPADPALRRERAEALLLEVERLRISTIHGFCRQVLARWPLEAGLHPAFSVDADERGIREIAREVVEEEMRAGYGRTGGPWRALADAGWGPPDVADALEAILRAGVPEGALDRDPFAPEEVAALLGRVRAVAGRVAELTAPVAGGGSGLNISAAMHHLAARLAEAPDLDAALALAADGAPTRLAKWRRGDFGKKEERALGARALEQLPAAAGELEGLFRHLGQLDPELTTAARAVLRPLLARARALQLARGVVPFAELLRRTHELLRGRPDIAARLREGIDQLLLDEFQDTDPLQYGIVGALALEAPPGARPGLFIVGDPKQSIYGWRQADLAAYEDFVRRVEEAGGERLSLFVNFRSVPAILDEVARIVGAVMEEEPGVQPAFQRLEPCPDNARVEGFRAGDFRPVEHHVAWPRHADGDGRLDPAVARRRGGGPRVAEAYEAEARAVAREIAHIHREHGVAWSEFALLLRAATALDEVLEALRREGVPYAVERDRSYYRRRDVLDALSLAEAVLDPDAQLALVAWLRSPWVGVPDAALLELWRHGLPDVLANLDEPAPDRLAEVDRAIDAVAREVEALDIAGMDRIPHWPASLREAVRVLAALRASARRDPPQEFVRRLRLASMAEPLSAARYTGPWRVANLDRFFRDLAVRLSDAESDPTAVLRELRRARDEDAEEQEARPPEAAEDAVRVMTVHRAKGMTFGHVYLLQCARESGGRSEPNRPELAERDGRWEYRLFGAATPGWADVLALRARTERAEAVRTLYVALTRPQHRLVVSGRIGRGTGYESLLDARPIPDALEALAAAPEGGALHEEDGVLWALAERRLERPAAGAGRRREADAPRPAEVARHWRTLRARREAARARMERPRIGTPSGAAHHDVEPRVPAAVRARIALARDEAMAVGEAVHRALELWDPAEDPAAALLALAERADELLPFPLRPAVRERAAAAVADILRGVARGPLARRLADIRVLAREIEILARPDGGTPDGALDAVAGAIDLVYEDPDDGTLVVADFKTDRVDAGRAAEHALRYASQGAAYVAAVQAALGLPAPPRFEVWFLRTGEVVAVPTGRATARAP